MARHEVRCTALALLVALGACSEVNVPPPATVAKVRVVPDTVSLRIGDTITVAALPLDSKTTLISQQPVTWASSASGVVTVDAAGRVRAVGPGKANVTATSSGTQGSGVVLVSGQPASIAATAGQSQSAPVNTALPVVPVVTVKDSAGNPVSGVPVTFTITAGNGSLAGGTGVTARDGTASAGTWTLGPAAGTNTLTASITGTGVTGNPVTFNATATVGGPSAATSTVAASPSTIAPSTGLAFSTITVTVRDSTGSTIAGASVVLSATGSGNVLTQPTAPTNAQGIATGSFSSSVAETKVISAKVNGSVSIAQTASILVTSAAPAGLGIATAPGGAVAYAPFTTQPVVEIRDAFGNRVPGATNPVTVTLVGGSGATLASQGGSLTVSAVNGQATFSGLVIRGIGSADTLGPGKVQLQFSSPGYTAVTSDTLVVGVSYSANVAGILTRNCAGCHNFTFATTVNQPSSFAPCAPRTRVTASDTVSSVLYEKIRTTTPACGGVMPQAGLMSARQIQLIRDWILQGARNN